MISLKKKANFICKLLYILEVFAKIEVQHNMKPLLTDREPAPNFRLSNQSQKDPANKKKS